MVSRYHGIAQPLLRAMDTSNPLMPTAVAVSNAEKRYTGKVINCLKSPVYFIAEQNTQEIS